MRWGRRVRIGVLAMAGFYLVLRLMIPGGDGDGAYRFLNTDGAGNPVAYPCRPLHYMISTAHAPPDFETIVHGAVGLVSAASGYSFRYDGTTTNRDFRGRPGDPILIGFAGSGEVPRLAGDTAGLGGSALSSDRGRYTHGSIALDAKLYQEEDSVEDRRAILMHELGHVLGLDHVEDDDQLMHRQYSGRQELGEGDVAGLRALHAQSCRPAS